MHRHRVAGPRPSTSVLAALFVVMACLLVLGVNGWRSMSARQQQLAETKTSVSNLARAVSQHANDTLRLADTALITIVQQMEAETETDGLDTDRRESMHRFLMRLTHEIPLLDKLAVMDDQGRWLVDSQPFMRHDLASEFREYFIYHRDNGSAAAFVGPPLRDRTTGAWAVTLSRRINSPSGQFAGVAVASISLAYFQRFHDRFDIGNDGAIILMLAEGKVLTHRPAVENLIGKNVSDRPLYSDHLALKSEGTALLTPRQDGIERIYGYVRLTGFPLIAVAALGKEEVLEPWRSDTSISAIAVAGLVLLLELLGFRLVRQIRLRAKTESALAASEFRWKNALESTGDVAWDLEHQNGTVKMSKEWAVLMGYPPDDPGRKIDSFNNLVHPEDRPAAREKFERYLRGETSEFINTQRVRTRDGEWKWLLTRGMAAARGANGQPLHTLGTHTDISEQKAHEEMLRTARDALEARVDQRTRELRHNNALLLNEVTERRRAEQALQESELRWKFALEGAGDGVWDWDIPGRRLHTSRRWRAMLAYGDEEATESIEAWREHIHPDDVERVSRMALDAASGRIPAYHAELRRSGRNGAWTWVLDRGTIVSRDAHGKALRMIGTTIDITERKAAQEKIQRLAYYDPLTQLPNRVLLRERLQALLSSQDFTQGLAALFFIDLDNFKTLNDSVGHDQGDLLLQEVAQRLNGCVDAEATVARLGGDEFVVLLPGLAADDAGAESQAMQVARQMIASLNAPYCLATLMHHSTVSIGIALISQQSGTVTELLKRADLAMYRAKNAGKNTLRLFTPDMQQAVTARAAMEADLRQALAKDEFILHYQPQVDGSRVMGAEALVRWRSPARGLVSPALFIPLAEESGLILELGHKVLEAACATLAHWADVPAMAHLSVSVNVSARQFLHSEFVTQVLDALAHSGANPHRLKLELTESVIIEEVDTVIDRMALLKSHGVMFSLDDFGTGYSSLAYLKRLPLDQIKIDQSFVRDVLEDSNDAAIVRSIIALGQSLGLTLIAEGVETAPQRDFLAAQGCPACQGYLFSKPLPLAEFEAYCITQGMPAPHFA